VGDGRRAVTLAMAMQLGAVASPAGAAEWYLEPRIAQDLGYDDNIGLDAERDDSGGLVSSTRAALGLGGRSPVLDLRLDAALTYNDYRRADESSSHIVNLRGEAIRHGPRTDLGLILGFLRDSSIDDFLDDTGRRRRTNQERYTYTATPYVTHLATPRDRLNAALTWRTRDGGQDDEQLSGTDSGVDFTTWSGNAGWRRTVTRRTTLGLELYGSHYDSSIQESANLSPRAFVGYRYEERVDLSLAAGPGVSRTETDERGGGTRSETQLSYTLDGTARIRLGEVTDLTLNASHYLEPSGDQGEVRQTGRVSATLGHRLTQRLRLDLAGLGQQQREVGGVGDDRVFVQASAGLAYELTPRLDLGLRYRLRYERFGGDSEGGDDATSNALFLGISYDFPVVRTSW
jgi:opacity protein-like surface antigen